MEEIIETIYCPVTNTYYPIGKYDSRLVNVKRIDPLRFKVKAKYKEKILERRLLAKV